MQTSQPLHLVRFGPFRLDLKTGELHRGEQKVRLQEQPFQILKMLLEHPGEVVSREEIRKTLWSDGTIVEFDNGVHGAIKRLRLALRDSAEEPRYIETLPRKGYRFIYPLEIPVTEETVPERPVGLAPPEPRVDADSPAARTPPAESKKIAYPKSSLAAGLIVIASTLFLVAGYNYWINRQGVADTSQAALVVPLTTYEGVEGEPSFSPDGNQVAFVWNGEARDNEDIYIKQIGVEPPRRLTTHPGPDFSPAWSPDGQVIGALRVGYKKAFVSLIPVNGGPGRQIAELPTSRVPAMQPLKGRRLCWHPGGEWLAVACDQEAQETPAAIFLLSPKTGERRQLTFPAPEDRGDTNPAFSPDGRSLAFARFGSASWEIYSIRLTDKLLPGSDPRQLTFGHQWSASPAWMPGGKEIVYISGSDISSARLWRISADHPGKPQPMPFSAQGTALDPAVSLEKSRLVYRDWSLDINLWRCRIPETEGHPVPQSKLRPSTRTQSLAQYSPDGRTILYVSYVSGNGEIWVCDEDGSNPLQLTHLAGPTPLSPRWSPDGRDIIFHAGSTGKSQLYIVRASGGQVRRLAQTVFNDQAGSYSQDGQWIYFASDRSGALQIWKMRAAGGEPTQITSEGGSQPRESTDGQTLFYLKLNPKDNDSSELWKVPVSGGEETRLLQGDFREGIFRSNFDVKERGIYYAVLPDFQKTQFRFFDYASGEVKHIATLEKGILWGFSVSPDEQSVLYTKSQGGAQSDLVLVENFR